MRIEIQDLCKRYDNNYALDHVNMTMESGMFGLLGANGAGKTTLIRILASILDKTSGKIIYDGEVLKNQNELRKNIGYIPQKFSFYPNMTVFQIMDYFCGLNKIKKNRNQRIEMMLDMVNLTDLMYKKTKELSGGMRQRLGIAIALLPDPKLLLVDEPTVGLDPKERIRFSNILTKFSKDRTILISSHIVGDIEATCKNLAILNYGSVVYNGSKEKLFEQCKGKIWQALVTDEEEREIESRYTITSKTLIGDLTMVKIVAEKKPIEMAIEVEPNLNDAYIYMIDMDETGSIDEENSEGNNIGR